MFRERKPFCIWFFVQAVIAWSQVAFAQDGTTRIDIGDTFVGSKSRVTFNTTVVLSGRGRVDEVSRGHNSVGQTEARQFAQDLGGARWQVLGPNRLQRTINYENHYQILQVNVGGRSCATSVTTRLKAGKTTYILRNMGDGSSYAEQKPRYENLTCAIR